MQDQVAAHEAVLEIAGQRRQRLEQIRGGGLQRYGGGIAGVHGQRLGRERLGVAQAGADGRALGAVPGLRQTTAEKVGHLGGENIAEFGAGTCLAQAGRDEMARSFKMRRGSGRLTRRDRLLGVADLLFQRSDAGFELSEGGLVSGWIRRASGCRRRPLRGDDERQAAAQHRDRHQRGYRP